MPRARTLLVLGRASNLPTVWSNCLAGWWLGGKGNWHSLPFLLFGASCLYIGGMYLNDAFDVEFDRQYRPERPIPSGAISEAAVWRLGWAWLGLGAISLAWIGLATMTYGLALLTCIVIYDAIHKATPLAPLLMGSCRMLLYLVAASSAEQQVTGYAVWCGLALAVYVIGLSFLAQAESAPGIMRFWPLVLLAAPIPLAILMNPGPYRESALVLSGVLALWCFRCLRSVLWTPMRDIGRTVSGLLAGIVFVDLLALANAPKQFGIVFLILFGLALLFQRFIPAT